VKRTFALLLLAAAPLVAQQPQQQPSPSSLPKLVESIDVKVINVDVVVTDKKGNPVNGLTKDDFELYENGQPKLITNFYEVEGKKTTNVSITPAGAEKPITELKPEEVSENLRRRIIFYIDNLSLMPFNRNRVFKEMKDFAKSIMRPGDEAMVATYNRSMKIRANFTRDPALIQQTLDVIAGESALGVANKSERRDYESRINDSDNYDDAVAIARQYAQSVEHDLRQSVESLNGLMTTLAGVEGKKVLVLTTEGFQMQPGREMFYLVDDLSREKGWPTGGTMLEGMTFNESNLLQGLAKTANANGITMYTIHAGGLGASMEGNLAERDRPIPFAVTQAALTNSTESLQMLAEMTGGLASINTNNFAGAFKNIQRDLDSYYSLGYKPVGEASMNARTIEVKAKDRAYRVRARENFVLRSPKDQMNDRVIANLFTEGMASEWPITLHLGPPRDDGGRFVVPVQVVMPSTLTLLPQEQNLVGGFIIYLAIGTPDGRTSDVLRRPKGLKIPASAEPLVRAKPMTFSTNIGVKRGESILSVAILDQISGATGYARAKIVAH
jgi:VWFA-related protein